MDAGQYFHVIKRKEKKNLELLLIHVQGLFAADDWQCKQCGNVNWARRANCNMCNGPKVGIVEERTGYGGGFMERDENPEYK